MCIHTTKFASRSVISENQGNSLDSAWWCGTLAQLYHFGFQRGLREPSAESYSTTVMVCNFSMSAYAEEFPMSYSCCCFNSSTFFNLSLLLHCLSLILSFCHRPLHYFSHFSLLHTVATVLEQVQRWMIPPSPETQWLSTRCNRMLGSPQSFWFPSPFLAARCPRIPWLSGGSCCKRGWRLGDSLLQPLDPDLPGYALLLS